jgi:hypothetical protein
MTVPRLAASFVAFALAAGAPAQYEKLKVGDPAPAMEIEKWVTGDAVTMSAEGAYVVLFCEDASALGPLARPAEVHAARGLVVVVIVPQDAEKLQDAVRGQKGSFRLAQDQRGTTQRAWVWNAGIQKLPVAFIVGRGKIMFMGQARDADFEEILGKVVAGRYDPVLQKQAQPKLDAARRARKVKNWRVAEKSYDEVIALDARVFAPVAIERFEMVAADMDDKEGAYAYARDALIAGIFAKDAGALRMLAEKIVTDPRLDRAEDLDVALAAAQQAIAVAGPSDPESLATAALIHFHRGERGEAVELQTEAYFLARPEVKGQYKRVLDGYKGTGPRPAEAATPR